jgi:hypothetical protein
MDILTNLIEIRNYRIYAGLEQIIVSLKILDIAFFLKHELLGWAPSAKIQAKEDTVPDALRR